MSKHLRRCRHDHAGTRDAHWRDTSGLSPHLVFGSDVALRTRWFVPASFQHPAKLHLGLLHWLIERYTLPGETIADPMTGSGGILYAASLQRHVIAREIEPRWIELMRENAAHIIAQAGLFAGHIDIDQADARQPWGYTADHILRCNISRTSSSGGNQTFSTSLSPAPGPRLHASLTPPLLCAL